MKLYLVRHGKDDDTIRGGWSQSTLTEEGIAQSILLAESISDNKQKYDIKYIYSSDLSRAVQTAEPIATTLRLPIILLNQFREVNNGKLSGMNNDLAKLKYPGLFWNTLDWEEHYPNGESPKEFFNRISVAWNLLSRQIYNIKENVLLITHSGVINIILHQVNNTVYSNKDKQISIKHATLIELKNEQGKWNIGDA